MAEKLDLDALERDISAWGMSPTRNGIVIALIARIRELESASQPGGGEAEYMLQLLEAAGHITPDLIAKARELAQLALAAPSAGDGGAEGDGNAA